MQPPTTSQKKITPEEYQEILASYNEYLKKGQIAFITFHQSYGYEEFIEGIRPVLANVTEGDIQYELQDGVFKNFCKEAGKEENSDKKYVFIIDEINRGNISKIFGELITLIESNKRIGAEEQRLATLPYSGEREEKFGVPKNVYLLGTMNTADRSIALLDTALRRRFRFIEMLPKSELFKNIVIEGINIEKLLETMNKRIEVLLDREHQIGHAYFMPLRKNPTLDNLADIFQYKIMPLLQEYFYDDYEKIRLVLGDNQSKNEAFQFVKKNKVDVALFGTNSDNVEYSEYYYTINDKEVFNKPESYAKLQ